jgi:hypothetical protein
MKTARPRVYQDESFTKKPIVFFQVDRNCHVSQRSQDLKDREKRKSISGIDIYKHTLFPWRAGVGLHSFDLVRWSDWHCSKVGVRFGLQGSLFRKANSRYRPVVAYLKGHAHSSAITFFLFITRQSEIQGFRSLGKYFPPHPVVS